jgi:hypothetical protein
MNSAIILNTDAELRESRFKSQSLPNSLIETSPDRLSAVNSELSVIFTHISFFVGEAWPRESVLAVFHGAGMESSKVSVSRFPLPYE